MDLEMKYDPFIVTTLVDCLVRRMMLNDARSLILDYECYREPYETMWTALLNGAKQSKDINFANQVYDEMSARFILSKDNVREENNKT